MLCSNRYVLNGLRLVLICCSLCNCRLSRVVVFLVIMFLIMLLCLLRYLVVECIMRLVLNLVGCVRYGVLKVLFIISCVLVLWVRLVILCRLVRCRVGLFGVFSYISCVWLVSCLCRFVGFLVFYIWMLNLGSMFCSSFLVLLYSGVRKVILLLFCSSVNKMVFVVFMLLVKVRVFFVFFRLVSFFLKVCMVGLFRCE